MMSLTAITRSRRIAALLLMFAVSGVALMGCAGGAYQDPNTATHIDFPFLGLNSTDGPGAALAG